MAYICSEHPIGNGRKTEFVFVDVKTEHGFLHDNLVKKSNMKISRLEGDIYLVKVVISKKYIDDMAEIAAIVNGLAKDLGYDLTKYQEKYL